MSSLASRAPARRAQVAVALWLLFLAACLLVVTRTTFTTDLSAFLPRNPNAEQRLLVEQLKTGVLSRTLLAAVSGGTPQQRAQASLTLATQLRTDAQFESVVNGALDPAQRDRDGALLFRYRYLLSPAVTPDHFTVGGLKASFDDTLDLLASPAGLALKPLVNRDPTGEMLRIADTLDAGGHPPIAYGAWSSRDGQRAMLLLTTEASGSNTDAQEHAIDTLRGRFDALHSGLSLEVTGAPTFAVDSRHSIKSEVTRLSIISAVLIVTILLFTYRSAVMLGLSLVPVLSGALAGVAAVSLGFGSVHGITLGFGTTLIGEAVDYSIYLFVQSGDATRRGGLLRRRKRLGADSVDAMETVDTLETANALQTSNATLATAPVSAADERTQRRASRDARLRRWVARSWPTVRLGMLTSICGFSALTFSSFPGLAQLGVYSIAGLVVAAAVTRWVLPVLTPLSLSMRDLSVMGGRFVRAADVARRFRWLALGVLAAVVLLAVLTHRQPWLNDQLNSLSPVSPAAQARDVALREQIGAPDARYMAVVSAPTLDAALQGAEAAAPALDRLIASHAIGGYESPARYLPSEATQRSRQNALPSAVDLRARLAQAAAGTPFETSALEAFIGDVDTARTQPLLNAAWLRGTSLGVGVNALVNCSPGRCDALLPLRLPDGPREIDAPAVQAALAGINDGPARITFVDLKGASDAMYERYMREAIKLSLAGLVLIIVLLALMQRSFIGMLRVLSPLAAAVLAVVAGLALAGISLTLLHVIGLLLIVAVGSNYALFFNRKLDDDIPQAVTFASLAVANLTTVAGFGVLALSSLPLLRAFGETVAPGAILALWLAALLAPRERAPVAGSPGELRRAGRPTRPIAPMASTQDRPSREATQSSPLPPLTQSGRPEQPDGAHPAQTL
jgi:predicted exporter